VPLAEEVGLVADGAGLDGGLVVLEQLDGVTGATHEHLATSAQHPEATGVVMFGGNDEWSEHELQPRPDPRWPGCAIGPRTAIVGGSAGL
jgi:hypothetical protein